MIMDIEEIIIKLRLALNVPEFVSDTDLVDENFLDLANIISDMFNSKTKSQQQEIKSLNSLVETKNDIIHRMEAIHNVSGCDSVKTTWRHKTNNSTTRRNMRLGRAILSLPLTDECMASKPRTKILIEI